MCKHDCKTSFYLRVGYVLFLCAWLKSYKQWVKACALRPPRPYGGTGLVEGSNRCYTMNVNNMSTWRTRHGSKPIPDPLYWVCWLTYAVDINDSTAMDLHGWRFITLAWRVYPWYPLDPRVESGWLVSTLICTPIVHPQWNTISIPYTLCRVKCFLCSTSLLYWVRWCSPLRISLQGGETSYQFSARKSQFLLTWGGIEKTPPRLSPPLSQRHRVNRLRFLRLQVTGGDRRGGVISIPPHVNKNWILQAEKSQSVDLMPLI